MKKLIGMSNELIEFSLIKGWDQEEWRLTETVKSRALRPPCHLNYSSECCSQEEKKEKKGGLKAHSDREI